MADGTTFSIKRQITVRAVVTPRWKEDAERELSNAISSFDQQLAQLEQEGQRLVDEIRRQSINPLDPRVQEQVGSLQQQVAAKRAEIEEQKRQVLEQQRQVRELEMEQIVDQGQLESFCQVGMGDNLVEKLQAAVVVRDGVIEAMEGAG
ncbi:MAG: YlqD family protein [Cyanobacteria bacterium]|jgi:YlqD protein|nr:YlqD family protein [Cyanobacteriota bacterium]